MRFAPGAILVRLARIVAIALPLAAVVALIAHARGIGWDWNCPAGYFIREGAYFACAFVGSPILWGPWAQTGYPVGAGLFAAAMLWFSYGLLAGIPAEWLLRRRTAAGELANERRKALP